ncbi:MAG: hypothetical protein SCH70_04335 [Candidatus Methanoperedens sp.]|nr:hypothetical protein [Candidatus Methanoperedens sp.]
MTASCDKAIEILQATNDGDGLDPLDLKLVEMAVNVHLNDLGMERFNQLHVEVTTGGYRKPWFHGIEHLTIDNAGLVYWKGFEVENYTLSYAFSEKARKDAEELARRCKHIESLEIVPETNNVIWRWEEDYKHRKKEVI